MSRWTRRRAGRRRMRMMDGAPLWRLLTAAMDAGDEAAFVELVERHQDEIIDDVDAWTYFPADFPEDPDASERYLHMVMIVGRVLADRFGRPELLELLTEDPGPEQLHEWGEALERADAVMETNPDEAKAILDEALQLGSGLAGPGIDRMVALTFGRLGTLAFRQGDLATARLRTGSALVAAVGARDLEGILAYLRNLYELELKDGRPMEAARYAERGLAACDAGGQPEEVPGWLVLMAEAELDAEASDDASEHARSAIAEARKRLFADAGARTVVFNNAAEVLRRLGHRDEAAGVYGEAIAARRSAGLEDVILARILGNLAHAYLEGPDPSPARAPLEESLALAQRLLPAADPFIAETLNNLGAYHYKRGEADAARRRFNEALTVREASSDGYGASLANLAELEMEAGRDADAKAALDRIDAAASRVGEPTDDKLWRVSRLVTLHIELGNFVLAERLLRELRSALGEETPRNQMIMLFFEADIRKGLGDLDAAAELMAAGVQVTRAGGDFAEDDLATGLNNAGLLAFYRGRLEDAEDALQEALRLRTGYLAVDAPEVLDTRNNLALVLQHERRFDEAEELYRQVLEARRRQLVAGHPNIAQSMFNLGMLLLETGRSAEAFPVLRDQFEAENALIDDMFRVSAEDERMAYVAKLRENLDTLLVMIHNFALDEPEGIRLAFDVLLQRKGIVADAMAAERRSRLRSDEPGALDDLRGLNEVRRRISRLILDGPGGEDPAAHTAELARLIEERRQREAGLARASKELDQAVQVGAVDRAAVAAALPPGSALVEYLHAALPATGGTTLEAYLAFVLNAGEPDQVSLFPVGLADTTDAAVRQFRRAIVSGFIEDDFEDPHAVELQVGQELRRVLIDRVLEATGDRTHLVLSPDGELGQLPFECLPIEDLGVVGDALRIDYVTSARDLLRGPGGASGTSLVVADPDFDLRTDAATSSAEPLKHPVGPLRSSGIRFDRLEDTAVEADLVRRHLDAESLTRADALEGRIAACRSPRVLHFATHGFFLEDTLLRPDAEPGAGGGAGGGPSLANPLLRSGLALAGANAWLEGFNTSVEADDGLLTAEDVSGMDLTGTELVVLSACDTGLGEYRRGEGVFGLRRAFAIAGADTLVMSLWQVPTEQTTALMEVFYDRLAAGSSPTEALREAKTVVRERWSETFFWGAFVAFGATTS